MNAKLELLKFLAEYKVTLECAYIEQCRYDIEDSDRKKAFLRKGYSPDDLEQFLRDIDYEYYDGYGTQELDGILWFKDGTWADRHEYDGSEWWNYQKLPEIPDELKENE